MEIKLRKGILHILDTNGELPVYSQKELDMKGETVVNFITKHTQKNYFR